MPNPKFQRHRLKHATNKAVIHNELEFSEELSEFSLNYNDMKPVPQPKDYEEIEY
ncbi:hypothetical protein [Bacillus sp. Marseille-P3661]|uniref:hypothetical protein n=1 Tax=Bacillus sp. Marseille-P3661 TaxID=1936234 RepID=UPI0015E1748B|nr:hypothetical protein [Bacillus sp. Marseille-P3661]